MPRRFTLSAFTLIPNQPQSLHSLLSSLCLGDSHSQLLPSFPINHNPFILSYPHYASAIHTLSFYPHSQSTTIPSFSLILIMPRRFTLSAFTLIPNQPQSLHSLLSSSCLSDSHSQLLPSFPINHNPSILSYPHHASAIHTLSFYPHSQSTTIPPFSLILIMPQRFT